MIQAHSMKVLKSQLLPIIYLLSFFLVYYHILPSLQSKKMKKNKNLERNKIVPSCLITPNHGQEA